MQPLKIFISSTYIDLIDYRQKAIEIVVRSRCMPLAMEYFGSQSKDPESVCEKEIKECDIFIGIYARRYGFTPRFKNKSITHLEYELAKKENKECLCFIVDKNFSWPIKLFELDKQERLEKFLAIIQEKETVSFFTTESDFAIKFSTSLGNLLREKQEQARGEEPIAKRQQLIPIAPTPFIAHPYPLPQNFTGREAEKSMLSNWFYNAGEPMLVLEAIGGMGKTALTWVWLKEILEKPDELSGVIWWSFYDAPFETFLPVLFHYLTSREVQIDAEAYYYGGDLTKLFSILYRNNFLLVLDGFERALRGYAGMSAMYIQEKALGVRSLYGSQGDAAHKGAALPDWDKRQREPVHPFAPKFLRALTTGKTKTLLTTRLFPTPLEDIAGVKHELLAGLSRTDAVRFLRKEGVNGSRAELERAGEIYSFHPLMLKQLSAAIQRTRLKDISAAFQQKIIDQAEPQKILQKSFSLLHEDEKQIATTLSVLRSAFSFDIAHALFPKISDDKLWQLLCGLQQLGFLFYDAGKKQFDFHPILRSFLYDNLTARDKVHQQAASYFEALPKAEKVMQLEDLTPVIELYHHLIGAGKFDEAIKLFIDRLHSQVYYQLSSYNLYIELLKELFPAGEDQPPRLKKEGDQAWTLAALANSYSLSGQPARAVPLFLMHNKLREKDNDKKNLAIGLGNVANVGQIPIGQLSAAAAHLRKSIALCQEIKDEFYEAIGHQELGRVLAYQGRFENITPNAPSFRRATSSTADFELEKAINLFKNTYMVSPVNRATIYYSLLYLLQTRFATIVYKVEDNSFNFLIKSVKQVSNDLNFIERYDKLFNQAIVIRSYWLIGEAIIQLTAGANTIRIPATKIYFYDEPFQRTLEVVVLKKGNELEIAKHCLEEALRRCRKVNLVEIEAYILLAWARMKWVIGKLGNQVIGELGEVEDYVKEAREIAERAGYRLQMADIHLFGAEMQTCGRLETSRRLLGLTAREHLQLAKEYAKDVSTFEDLYQSKDEHFYDGIPEYEMLKRGMTEQERIENGYYVAYQIAEVLEKRL